MNHPLPHPLLQPASCTCPNKRYDYSKTGQALFEGEVISGCPVHPHADDFRSGLHPNMSLYHVQYADRYHPSAAWTGSPYDTAEAMGKRLAGCSNFELEQLPPNDRKNH